MGSRTLPIFFSYFQIDLRPVISQHYEICDGVKSWRDNIHELYCVDEEGKERPNCSQPQEVTLFEAAFVQCLESLHRLLVPLGSFTYIKSTKQYAKYVHQIRREELDNKGRYRRDVNTYATAVVRPGTWELTKDDGMEWRQYYDAALLGANLITKIVTDNRVKGGVQWLENLYKKSKVQFSQSIKRPTDNTTTLFDSATKTGSRKTLLEETW